MPGATVVVLPTGGATATGALGTGAETVCGGGGGATGVVVTGAVLMGAVFTGVTGAGFTVVVGVTGAETGGRAPPVPMGPGVPIGAVLPIVLVLPMGPPGSGGAGICPPAPNTLLAAPTVLFSSSGVEGLFGVSEQLLKIRQALLIKPKIRGVVFMKSLLVPFYSLSSSFIVR